MRSTTNTDNIDRSEKSIFEKIASREISAEIIWETDDHIAFLDINPLTEGHTLVVPQENIGDELFELEAEDYNALMAAAQEVAIVLKQKLKSDRILMWVEGFEVPHVHVHLIPTKAGIGFNELSRSAVQKAAPQDLAAIAKKIR